MAALAAIAASAVAMLGASAGVTAAAAAPAEPAPLQLRQPVVLLGEVHDNAAAHQMRLQAFRALLEGGARPVLAMEQLDRELQPAIDWLLARSPRPDAAAIIELTRTPGAAMGGGWNWDHYRPFIELALRYQLPIVAANVSRNDARLVMREGLAAAGFKAEVPSAVLDGIATGIVAGHCGQLDAPSAQRMALAQVARDQFMARVLDNNAAQGVVLLAGNGHVRTDLGAPRWLGAATRSRSEAIGVLETGDDTTAYDRRVFTAPQLRDDPCAGLKMPANAAQPGPR